jgi:hypothetical protein
VGEHMWRFSRKTGSQGKPEWKSYSSALAFALGPHDRSRAQQDIHTDCRRIFINVRAILQELYVFARSSVSLSSRDGSDRRSESRKACNRHLDHGLSRTNGWSKLFNDVLPRKISRQRLRPGFYETAKVFCGHIEYTD